MKITAWVLSSFDTNTKGASARKLTAFGFMLMMAYCHMRFVDHENVEGVLVIDGCCLLLILGIVTAEQVLKFKTDASIVKNAQDNGNTDNT